MMSALKLVALNHRRYRAEKALGERLDVPAFMTLFIAALVLRGKTAIYKRGERSWEERGRMYDLRKHFVSLVEQSEHTDNGWRQLLVRLGNMVCPGDTGSFGDFYEQFLIRWGCDVSIDLLHCDRYVLDLKPAAARCYLNQASPRMRELAENAAEVYLGNEKK